ncbi:unnamed protein product [Candidula unifasciata]|uniref:H-type lectin domain-containing protein n=1 Tax=Candidula unifasciata TaxID=100452 RepID=A0A8S3ZXU9_9EUPU|nr:unnamed protein product [Candidula unifasciata]
MIGRVLCALLIIAVSMTTLCQGARIVISATPTTISSGVTPTFTVRCALENSEGSTVSRVSTIVIRKVEGPIQRDVARIAYGESPVVGSWALGATVTGEVPDSYGFLQATWSSPGHLQAGGYNCEIVAVEKDGTNIKFKSNIQVDSTGQSVDDLAKLIAQFKDEIDTLKNTVNDLKTSKSECQNEIDTLKNTVNDLKSSKSQCQSEIDTLKRSVQSLNTNVANIIPPHYEQGSVTCHNSDSWGALMKERETVKEVRFSTAYPKAPQVDYSVIRLDVEQTKNLRYFISVKDLTTTGFKIVCGTWWDSKIYNVVVRWTSNVA